MDLESQLKAFGHAQVLVVLKPKKTKRVGSRTALAVPETAGSAEARRKGQLAGDMATFRIGVPLGRLGEAQDQANAIVFLASPEASYISGECIYVDGLQAQC